MSVQWEVGDRVSIPSIQYGHFFSKMVRRNGAVIGLDEDTDPIVHLDGSPSTAYVIVKKQFVQREE